MHYCLFINGEVYDGPYVELPIQPMIGYNISIEQEHRGVFTMRKLKVVDVTIFCYRDQHSHVTVYCEDRK